MNAFQMTAPDDWHLHLRDKEQLAITVKHAANSFKRAIVMPNLSVPISTVQAAKDYHARIQSHIDSTTPFKPLMTLYLNHFVTPAEISLASAERTIVAVKWYPKGVTTNAQAGVEDILPFYDTLQAMVEHNMPLLIHGETLDAAVDIFDRESHFIDHQLKTIIKNFPKLKIVLEHISTKKAVDFIKESPSNVAATITAHHLWLNRNDLLSGGIKPHYYCLPIVKKQSDQLALIKAATSGNPKFFLGTDSAPHPKSKKESACGCAGIYTAPLALPLYAECFEAHDALDKLEGFASFFGPDFYELERNQAMIELIKKPWEVPAYFSYNEDKLIPFMAGNTLNWQIQGVSHV